LVFHKIRELHNKLKEKVAWYKYWKAYEKERGNLVIEALKRIEKS